MIPEDIRNTNAWQANKAPTHFINRDKFPPQAAPGDTCMLPGTTIFLCIAPRRWKLVGKWSPELAHEIMRRADRLDTGREIWRWVVESRPKIPTEGCMATLPREGEQIQVRDVARGA